VDYAAEIRDLIIKANDDIVAFKGRYDERLATVQRDLDQLRGVRAKSRKVSTEHKKFHKALETFVRTGDDSGIKSMAANSNPDGGFAVLPQYAFNMIEKIWDVNPMRGLSRVETLGSGNTWVENIDNSENAAVWVGETQARPQTGTPTIGQLQVPVNETYCLIPISAQLMQDSMFDVGAWVEQKVVDKFARQEGAAFISGTGGNQPLGLLSAPTSTAKDSTRPWGTLQTIKSGSASSITADALHSLVWSLRIPYRKGASWLMNSNTASVIDQFRDSVTGRYLWRESLTDGMPATLLGYPVTLCEDMPDVTAGSLSIAFGNFKVGYLVVDRQGVKMLQDPFSAKPWIQFYAYRRVGGAVANSEAVKLMVTSA
jgi:HK97 family phage major capsid protein